MKWRITELEELKELPKEIREKVLVDFQKDYHFLQVYVKNALLVALILAPCYFIPQIEGLNLFLKFMVGLVLGAVYQLFEVNVIGRRVINDIINQIQIEPGNGQN